MTQALVILSVATEWRSGFGGISTVNRELCSALGTLGHEVHCIVLDASDADAADARRRNVTLHVAGSPHAPAVVRLGFKPTGLARVDAIIGHGRVSGWGARFQAQAFANAVALHVVHVAPQSIEWFKGKEDASRSAEERATEEAVLAAQVDVCFAIGPLLRAEYQTRLHAEGVAIHELLPGLSAIRRTSGPPAKAQALVLCRAEDAELKGLDIAARAMGRVAQVFPEAVLVVRGAPAGKGAALRDSLKKTSGPSSLEVHVFEYTADPAVVEDDILRASVVLMPSRHEGFGLSALEAISARVPVVVAARSGIGQMLREFAFLGVDAGEFLVPITEDDETDAGAWADAIVRVFEDRKVAFGKATVLADELEERLSWTSAAASVIAKALEARLNRGTSGVGPPPVVRGSAADTTLAEKPSTSGAFAALPAGLRSVPEHDALRDEYSDQIDQARSLLETYRPAEALRRLDRLKQRVWTLADASLKFRVEANRGAALGFLGRFADAGEALVSALQFRPDDLGAVCRAATGYLMLGQNGRARALAEEALRREPSNATAHAIRIEAAAVDGSYEELVASVPERVRETSDVSYTLGRVARRLGLDDEAIRWFGVAAAAKERGFHVEVIRALADALLNAVLGRGAGGDLQARDRDRLTRARNLLDEAYTDLVDSDATALKLQVLLQRATAKDLLDDVAGATEDLERATTLAPNDINVIQQRALVAFQRKDLEEACRLLYRVNREVFPDAAVVLADVLRAKGEASEVVAVLEGTPAERLSAPAREQRQKLLSDAYVDLNEVDKARALVATELKDSPSSVRVLVRAARVARLTNDEAARASTFVDAARDAVREDTPRLDVSRLADELFARADHTRAAELYEWLANPAQDSQSTRRLLWCYERIGEVGKALALARGLRERNGPMESITTLECALLEEIGDLRAASEICAVALARYPNDLELRTRRAWLAFRSGDLAVVDEFLRGVQGTELLDRRLGPLVARLLHLRDQTTRSVEIMYELRRERFNDPEVHLAYVQTCFVRGEATLDELGSFPECVAAGTAVRVQNAAGNSQWWILEDRSDPDATRGELSGSSPLALALLGRALGDEVSRSSDGPLRVAELLSKYVHALRESLALLGTAFPEQEGLERISIAPEEGDFSRLEEIVDAASTRRETVKTLYAEGKLTVGACGRILGVGVIDVAGAFAGDPVLGLHVAAGRPGEIEAVIALLKSRPTLVLDVLAFTTLVAVGALDAVSAVFGLPAIAQTSIDELMSSIARKRGLEGRGFSTLGRGREGMLSREVSAEEVARYAEQQAELLAVLREKTLIVPLSRALTMTRSARARLVDALGPDSADTAIAAAEEGRVLYSDDLHLRQAAEVELGTRGVWTQAVLAACKDAGALSSEQYAQAVAKIAAANHRHTSIDETTLLQAAKRDQWVATHTFRAVAAVLGGEQSSLDPAVVVAVKFLRHLWLECIRPIRRSTMAIAVIDSLAADRSSEPTARVLRAAVRTHFSLLPLAEAELLQIIARRWGR